LIRDKVATSTGGLEHAMSRSALLGAAGSALLTAAIAFIAASIFLQPPPAAGSTTGNATVVRTFYAAVNDAIATGDTSAIQRVVAPHFVEQNPLPTGRPGREGLEAFLRALHEIDPNMRLVVEAMVADESRVVAHVAIQREAQGPSFDGALVDEPARWGSVDVFRVADGMIVERWSQNDELVAAQSLTHVPLDIPVPSPRVVTIERFALAPGGWWRSHDAGPHLLFLEGGVLQVTLLPEAAPVMTLVAGGSWMAPPGAAVATTNVSGSEARLIVATFAVPQVPAPGADDLLDTSPGQILAGGLATDVRVGPAMLVLGQLTLGRNAQVFLSSAEGPLLIALDDGRLDVSAWGTTWGKLWVRRGSGGTSRAVNAAQVAGGDGLLLHRDGLIRLRNVGGQPASVLVLTLRSVPTSSQGVAGKAPRQSRSPFTDDEPKTDSNLLSAAGDLSDALTAATVHQRRTHAVFLGACPCPVGGGAEIGDARFLDRFRQTPG
jgi:predicted SnoaL-like aldol condensation-catalyzing enzyme